MLTHNLTCSSAWEIHTHSADYVGDRLALFALGSLASMATYNPPISILGHVPHLGHSVVTYEPWFAIIWACIVGAHLAVFVATVIWDWRSSRDEMVDGVMLSVVGRVEPDESREELVGGERGGGDTGGAEERGSFGGGERGRSEERGSEERETAGQQGAEWI